MQYKPKLKPENYFYLANGQIVKNLRELYLVVQNIDNDIFGNHVTPYKNDFAKWIYDVYRLQDLATELGQIKSKEELARVLSAYLRQKKYQTTDNVENKVMKAQETTVTQTQKPQEKIVTQTPKTQSQQREPSREKNQPQQHSQENKTQTQTKKKAVKYVWKSSESVSLEDHKKDKEEEDKKKKVQLKKPQNKVEIKKPEIKKKPKQTPKKIKPKQVKKTEIKKPEPLPKPKIDVSQKITDADKYFAENPVLTEHRVEAKKKGMKLEPIETVEYTGKESPQQLIDKFNNAYSRSYQRLSELRKAGFDTEIAEVMLFRIPPKINVYKSTNERKDATLVKRYLNEIIEELNNLNN